MEILLHLLPINPRKEHERVPRRYTKQQQLHRRKKCSLREEKNKGFSMNEEKKEKHSSMQIREREREREI